MLKRVLLVVITLLMVLNFTQPLQAQLCHPASEYDLISTTWEYLGPCDGSYNCLSYALGITNSWTWPWSGSFINPSQVNSFLYYKGYTTSGNNPAIISYSRYGLIVHFSKYINPSTCEAKIGPENLLTHFSLDPYTSAQYGPMATIYHAMDPLVSSISGSSSAPANVIYTWSANVSGGATPYNYQWYYSFSSPSSATNALGSTRGYYSS